MSVFRSRRCLRGLGVSALGVSALGVMVSLLPGCGAGMEEAGARAAEPDSVLKGILESVAETPPLPSGSPRVPAQEQAARPLDIRTLGYNEGDPQAPVKVMELSDFGCGYCRQFHAETYPEIQRIYIDGGYVEWKYVPVVMGFPNSLPAAIAGECAGEQDGFNPMRTRIFGAQQGWRSAEDPYPLFADMAQEEGLDVERFRTCVSAGWRDGRIRDGIRLIGELKVRGTPTFFVEGNAIPGAQPLAVWRDILDATLLQKGVQPPPR